MTDRFDWLPRMKPEAAPQMEFICEFWTLRGATGRDISCSAFRVATGLELRAGYSAEAIISTKLFRGVDADEQMATAADAWRRILIEKGLKEIAK